jgi:hypothetical protein
MRIPLHAPSDRSAIFHFVASLTDMHASLHAPSDRSAVFHFVAPLTDMRTPVHAPSDWSAVFHFVAPQTDMRYAYPIRLVCRIPLCRSSDRHARPSACPIRSDCRISLRLSSYWYLRHSRVLAADIRLFSCSRDVDTAFAAALLAPALVITMIQTDKTPLLQRSVAEEDHIMLK